MAKLTDDQLRFIIDIEATGAQGQINTLQASISKLETETKEYGDSLRKTNKDISDMEKQLRKMAKEGKEGTIVYDSLSKELNKAKEKAAGFEKSIKDNTSKINANKKSVKELTDGLKVNQMTMQQLRDRASQLRKQLDMTSASASPDAYRKLRKELSNTEKAMGKLGKQSNTIKDIVKGNLWTGVIVKSAQLLASAAKQAFDVIVDFEKENAVLASVLGTTQEGIKALTDDAKRLGATTAYTASQMTQLQTELAKLGFTQKEILQSTEAVQRFATATGADLAEAAKLAGAALRSFGLEASEMERVVSTMGVATTKSALDFTYLQSAMSTIAPVAKSFGFTIEDTTALLGTLANSGFDASSAATATRNILLNLADANGKLAKRLGEPIKSMDDLIPALRKLQEGGIDLAEALDLTDKRSVAAFSTFLSGVDTLEQLREEITGASDALKAMEEERLNTVSGSIALLHSAWEGLLLSFSNSKGFIKLAIDGLTSLIGAIQGAIESIGEVEQPEWIKGYQEQYDQMSKMTLADAKAFHEQLNKTEEEALANWERLRASAHDRGNSEEEYFYKLQIADLNSYRQMRKALLDQMQNEEDQAAAKRKAEEEARLKAEESARRKQAAVDAEKAKKERAERYKEDLADLKKNLESILLEESKSLLAGDITQEEFEARSKQQKEQYFKDMLEIAENYGEDTVSIEKQLVDLQIKNKQDADKKVLDNAKKVRRESLRVLKIDEEQELATLERKRSLGLISETQYAVKRQEIAETYAKARLGVETIYAEAVKDLDAHIVAEAQLAVKDATGALNQTLQDRLSQAREFTGELRDIFAETADALGDTLGGQLMGSMANAMDAITKFQDKAAAGFESTAQAIGAHVQMIGSVMNQVLDAASQITSQIFEMEANQLEAAKQKELAAVGDNEEEKARIEQEYAQKELDLKKKQADADAAIQTASLWVNTAMGIATAWATSMQLGPIAGPIMAAVLTAALLATAGIQQANIIAQRDAIKNQTLDGSGSSSGISANTSVSTTTIRPEYQAGGQGYSDGGYTGDGGVHEPAGVVHRGEYVVSQAELKNPSVVPMVRAIEGVRQQRKRGHSLRSHGFADGGYTDGVPGGANDELVAVVQDLADQVREMKSTPLRAYMNYQEFKETESKMDKLKAKGAL